MRHTPVKELRNDCVDVVSQDFDYGKGYAEVWEYYETEACEKCGTIFLLNGGGGEKHSDIDPDSDCDGYVTESEGPMMNYLYPLPKYAIQSDKEKKKLDGLPLCVVHLLETDEWGLALTGGGMDLSWEICEAYMRLGYLPPAHFARLPDMAGMKLDTRNKWILAGCTRSVRMQRNWCSTKLGHLSLIRYSLRENTKKAKQGASDG